MCDNKPSKINEKLIPVDYLLDVIFSEISMGEKKISANTLSDIIDTLLTIASKNYFLTG